MQKDITKIRFNPLVYWKSLLQSPRRLSDIESWHEHIPFAFVLVHLLRPATFVELGTHKGDSYCTFCQAVDVLNLDTKCYAVNTWKGDEHVGPYAISVYDELKEYHDPLYGRFSTLIRSTFDQALDHFQDGSIDLLHIDGCHTYKAAKHDFDSWLPKMSPKGVMLLHDSEVRESGFGVWKLWEEIEISYPTFAFRHGNGLGMVAVGCAAPEPINEFLTGTGEARQAIAEFFHYLGACRKQLADAGRQIEAFENSVSWRVTAPLRWFGRTIIRRTS